LDQTRLGFPIAATNCASVALIGDETRSSTTRQATAADRSPMLATLRLSYPKSLMTLSPPVGE
jgi:hypothetical protein